MADSQAQRPITNARSIKPKTPEPWTVIVQVLQKSTVKLSKDGKKFQGYVLVDEEGTIIGATAYQHHVGPVSRLLVPYQRYHISNAYVKDALPEYKISDYPSAWTLSTWTPIELIYDPVPKSIPCEFEFTKFSHLKKWIDHDKAFTIKGLIVHSYLIGEPTTGNVTRNYVIVDEEKIPVMVRVWGDLLDNEYDQVTSRFPRPTVAILMNVKVTSYHGMSLGTGYTTCAFKNPPSAIEVSLREWYEKNSSVVNDMILEETYKDTDVLLPPPSSAELIPIPAAANLIDEMKVMWVCGPVHLIPNQESLWYKACQECNKTIKGNVTWEFTCTSCGVRAPGKPRSRIGVYVAGGGSTLPLTLFGHDAEKLVLYTAADLKAADEKNAPLNREISLHIQNKKIFCLFKRFDKMFQGSTIRTYPVLKMYLESEVADTQSSNADSTALFTTASSSAGKNVSALADTRDKQFFSPTTKGILNEIHDGQSKTTSAAATSSVKRPLTFPAPTTQPITISSTKEAGATMSANQIVTSPAALDEHSAQSVLTSNDVAKIMDVSSTKTQSPGKKLKNKED